MHFFWTFLHFLLQSLEVLHPLLQRLEVCLHPLLHCFRPSGHGDCGDNGGEGEAGGDEGGEGIGGGNFPVATPLVSSIQDWKEDTRA